VRYFPYIYVSPIRVAPPFQHISEPEHDMGLIHATCWACMVASIIVNCWGFIEFVRSFLDSSSMDE